MLRRFLPLLALLTLSVAVLLARLWDIQVVQHDVWATEAANIVRSYGVEPYRRGAILDRNGEVIVQDEKRYVLEFIWRDFRRRHPLGQLAMLRSLALSRPVGLDEARRSPVRAARGYTLLSPDDLRRFALGGELDADLDYVPAVAAETEEGRKAEATRARRRSRAVDMRFYIQRLLELSPRDVKELGELVEEEDCGDLSYVKLAGLITDESTDDILRRLERDVRTRDEQLTRLAGLIQWAVPDGAAAPSDPLGAASDPLLLDDGDRLVQLIEARRRAVDDETADALFRIALGFSPVRLNEQNLAALDLSWLCSALDWDRTRLEEWRQSRGTAFVNSTRAGFIIARSKPLRNGVGEASGLEAGDRFISALAHSFRSDPDSWEGRNPMPEDWREVGRFEVLDELANRLDGEPVDGIEAQRDLFSFQRESTRSNGVRNEPLLMELLGDVLATAPVGQSASRLAEELVALARNARGEWQLKDAQLVEHILATLHERLQRRIGAVFAQSAGRALTPGSVKIGAPWIERALETRGYVVRDRGARPKRVGEDPSIDLVLLVTRYRDEFAGFRARAQTQRIAVETSQGSSQPLASKLLGRVRSPFLVDVLQQRAKAERLTDLQRKRRLPEEDASEILALVDATRRPGEAVGGSGLEAWFDRELSGKSGYHEIQGLQDRVEGNRTPIYRGAEDGQDVTLTLDIELQRAAEGVLLDPGPFPPKGITDMKVDRRWEAAPVGAIVLATVDGEILAAASVPLEPGSPPAEGSAAFDWLAITDGESLKATDRTLSRPKAQPPGSIVKPLLAAYALEHLGLDPSACLAACEVRDDRSRPGTAPKREQWSGFGKINCAARWGHGGDVNLSEALRVSCNVYFAALGEWVFDPSSMSDAYRSFGFGAPTGVRFDDNGTRAGLVDSYRINPQSPLGDGVPIERVDEVVRQFLGNGLAHVDVNVIQVVRAYAGLATGVLPQMRLVRRVGDQPVHPAGDPLGIGSNHLATIHASLARVVTEGFGKERGLLVDSLGFTLAAKTGSADYRGGLVPPDRSPDAPLGLFKKGMRKHAWLAGWFPADEPRFVITVYVHDTSATASHSAAYVARKFLLTDAVQKLMAEPVPSGQGSAVEASAKRGRDR